MTTGTIFDIKRFAVHDGPGLRTTVFMKGCPLSCWTCHNPEGQNSTPEVFVREELCALCRECLEVCRLGAISLDGDRLTLARERCDSCGACADSCLPGALQLAGRTLSVAEVIAEIEKDIVYYDESGGGATFSGGEPLAQSEFLRALLAECQRRDINTVVDTSGHAPSQLLDSIAPLTDWWLYDLKLIDEGRHRLFAGVSNRWVLDNLRRLAEREARVIIRFPLLPDINDDRDNIERMGAFVTALPVRFPVDILPYHRMARDKYPRLGREYRVQDAPSAYDRTVEHTARSLHEFGLNVTIKGEAYATQ